jgi:hypothetical protein
MQPPATDRPRTASACWRVRTTRGWRSFRIGVPDAPSTGSGRRDLPRIGLCTDDGALDRGTSLPEGVTRLFVARYGARMVSTVPRSLDRHSVESIQDALVDLQLLRVAQMVVGTTDSSFSRLAAFGRNVPCVLVGRNTRRDGRVDRLVRVTGVRWLVRCLYRALLKPDQPFPRTLARLVRYRARRRW